MRAVGGLLLILIISVHSREIPRIRRIRSDDDLFGLKGENPFLGELEPPIPPSSTAPSPPGFEPSAPAIEPTIYSTTQALVDVDETTTSVSAFLDIDSGYGGESAAVEGIHSESANFGNPLKVEWPEALNSVEHSVHEGEEEGSGELNTADLTTSISEQSDAAPTTNKADDESDVDDAALDRSIERISGEIGEEKDCFDRTDVDMKKVSNDTSTTESTEINVDHSVAMPTRAAPEIENRNESLIVEDEQNESNTVRKGKNTKTVERRVHKYTFNENPYGSEATDELFKETSEHTDSPVVDPSIEVTNRESTPASEITTDLNDTNTMPFDKVSVPPSSEEAESSTEALPFPTDGETFSEEDLVKESLESTGALPSTLTTEQPEVTSTDANVIEESTDNTSELTESQTDASLESSQEVSTESSKSLPESDTTQTQTTNEPIGSITDAGIETTDSVTLSADEISAETELLPFIDLAGISSEDSTESVKPELQIPTEPTVSSTTFIPEPLPEEDLGTEDISSEVFSNLIETVTDGEALAVENAKSAIFLGKSTYSAEREPIENPDDTNGASSYADDETESTIFAGTGAFDDGSLSTSPSAVTKYAKASRGAVEANLGCPPPHLCGTNCFVYINEAGCQDCQCLWISLNCETDSDCPEDLQECEMGKCQCKRGYEQDMQLSGFCKKFGAKVSSTEVQSDAGEFPSSSHSEAEFAAIHGSSESIFNQPSASTENGGTTSAPESTETTTIYAGLYFGRAASRIKRDTRRPFSRTIHPSRGFPVESEDSCDDDVQCPPNQFCLQGDCWHLPERSPSGRTREGSIEETGHREDINDNSDLTLFPIENKRRNFRPTSPMFELTARRRTVEDLKEEIRREKSQNQQLLLNRFAGSNFRISENTPSSPILPTDVKTIDPRDGFSSSELEFDFSSTDFPSSTDPNIRMIEIPGRTSHFQTRSNPLFNENEDETENEEEGEEEATTTRQSLPPTTLTSTPSQPVRRTPSFSFDDEDSSHETFMMNFMKQKRIVEDPSSAATLEPPRRKQPKKNEEHRPGVWYEMDGPAAQNTQPVTRNPQVPKVGEKIFYDYTRDNIMNKPIRVEASNARGSVRAECARDVDCSNRTKCCQKRWCDRTNQCGTSRFCLPNCSMTKSVHMESLGQGSQHIDIIYD